MVKDKERKIAEHYYVVDGRTAKEIAILVGVTEATVSSWVSKNGWKARRQARLFSPQQRADNLNELLVMLAEERIDLNRQLKDALERGDSKALKDIRKSIAALGDEVSKWDKRRSEADKDAQVSISAKLKIVEWVFDFIKKRNERLYLQTIELQEDCINEIASYETN